MDYYLEYLKYLKDSYNYKKDKKKYDKCEVGDRYIKEVMNLLYDRALFGEEGYSKELLKREKEVRNLIEKVAVWYEFRYPTDDIDISSIDFEKDEQDLLNMLTLDEKMYLCEIKFPSIIYLDDRFCAHFHLDENSRIYEADELYDDIRDIDFEGKTVRKAYNLLVERNSKYYNGELSRLVHMADIQHFSRKTLLEAISVRILERGGVGLGARRAYIFSKTFRTCSSFAYSIDTSDPKLKEYLDMYIKDGGYPDANCLVNYMSKYDTEPYNSTVRDVLKELPKSDEEKKLYKRLVASLKVRAGEK